ncbi:MAG: hypothetical protein ACR2OW_07480 [Methyloligellaceae bacterium]
MSDNQTFMPVGVAANLVLNRVVQRSSMDSTSKMKEKPEINSSNNDNRSGKYMIRGEQYQMFG